MTDEPELPENAVTVVREFFAALELGAVAEALELVHPDIVWKNTGAPDVRGIKRVGPVLRGLGGKHFGFSADMHYIAQNASGLVATDRTDYLRLGPVRIAFHVSGNFELADGRIILWDDHFGYGDLLRGTRDGLIAAVRGR
ncbi:limonene-1,2-epoxide hydrolase family protein [Nocardia sp. NPDC059177]|uniref:limonene-1,2-epoxide hydrolase family protein n=1 Tax=Nocardia sp. NPDC059177 TaxID=3346759 RepID=UPI0036B89329